MFHENIDLIAIKMCSKLENCSELMSKTPNSVASTIIYYVEILKTVLQKLKYVKNVVYLYQH